MQRKNELKGLIKNAKRRENTLRKAAMKLSLDDIEKVKQLKLAEEAAAQAAAAQAPA